MKKRELERELDQEKDEGPGQEQEYERVKERTRREGLYGTTSFRFHDCPPHIMCACYYADNDAMMGCKQIAVAAVRVWSKQFKRSWLFALLGDYDGKNISS